MRRAIVAVTAFAFLFTLQSRPPVSAAEGPLGGWSDAGKLSTERTDPLTTLLSDGRVLVTGISGSNYDAIGNVDLYDPTRGWSLGPSLPSDPTGAVLAPLRDGGALLAGGVPWRGGYDGPGPGPTATASVYDAAKNAWTRVPDMASPRNGATGTTLPDGRVLVVGGYDRRVTQLPNPTGQPFCCIDIEYLPLASTEFFDPRSRTWMAGPSLNHGRSGQTAVELGGGRVLIVGGTDKSRPGNVVTMLSSSELFDPAQNRWLDSGNIDMPRQGFTLTALADGRALLAGGTTPDGKSLLRSMLIYDPKGNKWSSGQEMSDPRSGYAAALLKDGRVLVMGGVDALGRLASSVEFDPTQGRWITTGALTTARSGHAAIALQDGRVLVVGGTGSLGPLANSEVFNPSGRGATAPARTLAGPGHWQVRSPEPFGTLGQSATLLRNGEVLVMPAGGYGQFQVEVYDPLADRWTTTISRSADQSVIAGTHLADERVLLVTAQQEGQSPAKAEIIDLATGASRSTSSPGSISGVRLDLLSDGRVWLTGGPYWGPHTQFYDPSSDRWTPGPDVPSDLFIGTVTPLAGKRVLVGGIQKAMILDTVTGTWSEACCFPSRWQSYSATTLPSGDVLFAGGTLDENPNPNTTVQVASTRVMRWDHTTGRLIPAGEMPHAQSFHSTVVLADGEVLFAGGIVGDPQSDPGSAAELYDPIKDSWVTAASLPVTKAQASAVLLKDGHTLLIGGYGVLYGTGPTLEYIPTKGPAISPTSTESVVPYVAIEVVATLGLFGLAAFLTVNARRRWRRQS